MRADRRHVRSGPWRLGHRHRTQSHRRNRSGAATVWLLWTGRILLGLLALIVLLAASGRDVRGDHEGWRREALSTPGQLVDVGGYRLHLHCVRAGQPDRRTRCRLGRVLA